ncbi:hypothetical protein L6164_031876 [Bauhinia variegata]|uniref:Uncharacterized protein n=1 Tax=Bauhinia variegata TaxID=167791 RepID=A0ACB9KLT8_BAUVA|nr:hypothetical protein L6164_031876 [Bauhinia variegata]
MATFYTSSGSQRDSAPMFCQGEPLPNSYPETPILPSNITLYMNSGSYSDAIPAQEGILANLGGSQSGEHDFIAWREGRNEMLVTHSADGKNLQGQGLSLSLGTQIPSGIQIPSIHDQNPNPNFDSFLGPNPSIPGDGGYKSSSSRHSETLPPGFPEGNQELHREGSSVHGMPGVAKTLPNSKYLKAVQQLLDEIVDIRKAVKQPDVKSHRIHEDCSKEDDGRPENEKAPANAMTDHQDSANNSSCELSHAEKQDLHNKLTKLLSMLDEVDRRYKQYYHQMQIVESSFDVIAGRGAAKPYTALALQTISRHFRCLRDVITGQISATQKNLGEQDASENNKGVGISRLRFVDQQIRRQRALQQLGIMQHAWRPQRGLPESSVSTLRAWLFEHFLHPYPTDSDKIMLARQTGLTRSQVSNWFINARVRLWKPMIEEIYKEEIGDTDVDSSCSSENASKVTKSDLKTSNDMGDDLQHGQSSMANKNFNDGEAKDFRSDHVLATEITGSSGLATFNSGNHEGETEFRSVKQADVQRPNFDDCGFYPVVQTSGGSERFMSVAAACQASELGRFGTGSGVSLTLGLQNCEAGNFRSDETHHSFVAMREDDVYNSAAASSIGAETAEFERITNRNQQRRFSSPHLLRDF